MRRWASVALAATALLALPVAADASCRSKIGKGAHVVERTRHAVVYRVDDKTEGFEQSMWYGCEFRTGKLRRLDRPFDFVHVLNVKLAGHFVGYSAWHEEPAGTEILERVNVDDLRTGKHKRADALADGVYEPGASERVRSLVLKPNGSVAWIARRAAHDDVPVHVEVNELEKRFGQRTVDQDGSIDDRSLALSEDNRRIFWLNMGQPHDARLR